MMLGAGCLELNFLRQSRYFSLFLFIWFFNSSTEKSRPTSLIGPPIRGQVTPPSLLKPGLQSGHHALVLLVQQVGDSITAWNCDFGIKEGHKLLKLLIVRGI